MKILILMLFLIFVTNSSFAETIKFKSGKVVEGQVIKLIRDEVRVDTGMGIVITYFRDEIESIDGKELSPAEILVEAEDMPIKTTGGPTSGGWNIWINGYIEGPVDFPATGTYRFDIRARGQSAQGVWPNMQLRINQSTKVSFTVNSESWVVYTTSITVSQGSRNVAIAFTNDFYNPPTEDRNLLVDKITITKQ